VSAPPLPIASKPRRRARALSAAAIAVVIWGISFPASRVAVREVAPLALALLRFVAAAVLVWPLARRGGARVARADVPAMFLLGFLGVTIYFAFENWGLRFTTASHGSLIVATVPLGTGAVEAFQRRRPPGLGFLLGTAVSLAGVVVIVRPDGSGSGSLLGDGLMIGAMASWVAYTFLARRLMARYPSLVVTGATLVTGALTLLPLAVLEAVFLPPRAPSAQAWAAVAFLGLLASAAAYLLWNLALPVLEVGVSSNLLNVIPLVSVLTGVLLLGEPFTPAIAVGGALVLGGVLAVERTAARAGGGPASLPRPAPVDDEPATG
jgi:drug/metabolite transporter (DMT)-like permease